MNHTRELLKGLKAELVAAGVTAPIYFGDLPASPDAGIALTAYAAVDQPTVALSTIRVQAMCRGVQNDSLAPDDLADSVFNVLQGLENRFYASSSLHLIQCFRVSAVPLGIDVNNRSTRADNYEIDVDLPLTAGRPF